MSISLAYKLGTRMAALGWSEVEVGEWLADQGYLLDGLTAKRVQRAYYEQLNRG